MKRIVKAVVLLPLWPFIWVARDGSGDLDLDHCTGRGNALLAWYRR